jgi:RimJ/RimL family protein N-acetyltransferase
MELRDGDLVLRKKRPDDLDAITAACQDPEIPRWTRVPSPYTRADAEAFLERSAEEEAAGTAAHFLAVDADDRLLGSFSIIDIDRERACGEIGYWMAPEGRGRGVATRAVRLVSDWAFEVLGLTRLQIRAHRDNVASRRVAEKAGYRDTGQLTSLPGEGVEEAMYAAYVLSAS